MNCGLKNIALPVTFLAYYPFERDTMPKICLTHSSEYRKQDKLSRIARTHMLYSWLMTLYTLYYTGI